MRSECRDFVRKPEERRPRGTPRLLEEYNIKKCLKKVSLRDIEWFHLDEDRGKCSILVSTLDNLGFHKMR